MPRNYRLTEYEQHKPEKYCKHILIKQQVMLHTSNVSSVKVKASVPTEAWAPLHCFTVTVCFRQSLPPGVRIRNYRHDLLRWEGICACMYRHIYIGLKLLQWHKRDRFCCFQYLIDSRGVTASTVFVVSLTMCSRLLGAFAKLRKATISFVVSVRPSVRMEQLSSHWTDCLEIRYLSIFRKSVTRIQVLLKSDKNDGYFTWRSIYILDYILLDSS